MSKRGCFLWNDRARNTHVEATSNHPCPAQALGRMLATMGVFKSATLESGSQVVLVLMELYSTVGDLISLQYGGSEAHKKMGGTGPSASESESESQDSRRARMDSTVPVWTWKLWR